MKQLIIYDLDGTLVDTREDIARAANYLRSVMNLSPLTRETISGFVGRGVFHLVSNCLGTQDPKQVEKGIKIYRDYYGRHMLDNTALYPDTGEILAYFKNKNQAVVTNKPNPYSKDILHALGVGSYFLDIIAGDSEHPKKPDPAALFFLMKKCRAGKGETLFVGDSVVDIETARNAGVEIAIVSHGFEKENDLKSASPDFMVKNFKELLALAGSRKW